MNKGNMGELLFKIKNKWWKKYKKENQIIGNKYVTIEVDDKI